MNAAPEPSRFRYAVVGSGAVGCFYGARLARLGREVHFLMRRDLEHVLREGLRIESTEGDFHLPEVNCHGSTEEIGPVDVALIALKATGNSALDRLIPPLLGENTMLLTLQNGLGNGTYLAERFGGGRVMGGLCFVCLNRIAPGAIRHQGYGHIEMGEYSGPPLPRTRAVRQEFADSGVDCRILDDLDLARWRKLIWNVPFNGLAIAGGGIDVSRILADEDLLHLTRQLMGEVIEGAAKLGHHIPVSFAEENIENTRTMGAYRPSSLIDYLENREVEVEAIWGEPLRRGRKAGAEMGRLEMLYRLIRRLAVGNK